MTDIAIESMIISIYLTFTALRHITYTSYRSTESDLIDVSVPLQAYARIHFHEMKRELIKIDNDNNIIWRHKNWAITLLHTKILSANVEWCEGALRKQIINFITNKNKRNREMEISRSILFVALSNAIKWRPNPGRNYKS